MATNIEATLRQLSNENTAKTFKFNQQEAQKSRDFSEYMSNTSHQREVEDLKRAGLNPVLSSNGGAQAYSASSASGQADNSAVGLLASIYQTKLNNANAVKIAKLQKQADIKMAKINAQASKYASDNSYSATRYASDVGSANAHYTADTSYKGHTYGVDRSKYGMIYNFGQGATGHSAYSAGKKTGSVGKSLVSRAWKAVKKWFK